MIILQILLATIITERLLEGLHQFYWTRKLREHLVGVEQWTSDGSVNVVMGSLPIGPLREFIRCKFCQSWWMGWVVSLATVVLWSGWSWHWVWMGLVVGSLANMLHDVKDKIR